jgi:TraM recognition site of TraD and TraG
MKDTTAHTTQPALPDFLSQPPPDWIMFPSMFILSIIGIIYLCNVPKRAIGRARMATQQEIQDSRKAAIDALDTQRGLTLWVGMPKLYAKIGKKTLFIPDRHTVMVPQANEHLAAIATTGGGKTRYFLNRLGFSAAQQDLPIIALDAKGDEETGISTRPPQNDPLGFRESDGQLKDSIAPSSELAGFALDRGYDVWAIAPFFKDSCCINPVSTLEDAEDTAAAESGAMAFVANAAEQDEKKDFFSKAAIKLFAAAFLMARGLEYGADMATVHKILVRLNQNPNAMKDARITEYQRAAFDQFLASLRSGETAGSIITTAMDASSRAISREITATFCRATNVPVILKRKQMLIFRIHPRYASVVAPFIGACLEIVVNRNIYGGTGLGGFLQLDEIPQIKMPSLPSLLGVARSKNWAVAIGLQGHGIMEEKHGKAPTAATFENIGTTWLGKIADKKIAKEESERFGDEDVQTISRSSAKGGGSTKSDKQRKLVPVEEIMGQPSGHAVFISPGTQAIIRDGRKVVQKRVSVPYRHQFVIPKRELRAMAKAKKTWLKFRNEKIEKGVTSPLTNEQLAAREKLAHRLLPDPIPVAQEEDTNRKVIPDPQRPPSSPELEQFWSQVDAIQSQFT